MKCTVQLHCTEAARFVVYAGRSPTTYADDQHPTIGALILRIRFWGSLL